jgi:hypothetical protein
MQSIWWGTGGFMILGDGINALVATMHIWVGSLQQVGSLFGLGDSNAGVAAGLWLILQAFFFTTKAQTRLVSLDASALWWASFSFSSQLSWWCLCGSLILDEWHLHEQGATILPAPSKERQLKIVKGSIVYYLRTINRDYRQVLVSFVMKLMPKYQTWLKDECIVGNGDYKTPPVLRFSCLNNTIEIMELLKKTTIWCRRVLFHAFSSNFLPYFRNLKWW